MIQGPGAQGRPAHPVYDRAFGHMAAPEKSAKLAIMSSLRPTFRQVALLVFALVLNALTWAQLRAVAAAPGPEDLCIQAHGATKPLEASDHGSTVERDTCLAHCEGLPTSSAAAAVELLAPTWHDVASAAVVLRDPELIPRRMPQQPRAPPVA